MEAVRFPGNRKICLVKEPGSRMSACGILSWEVSERWPAELGVPLSRLCKECKATVENEARGIQPRSLCGGRPKPFVQRYQEMCAKYGLDPKDPLGIL
jgi:hypothetical protein